MPTPTYTQLNSITLAANSTSVTFSNISQYYKDLILVINMQGTTTSGYMNLTLNSDASNFNRVYAVGQASTTVAGADSTSNFGGFGTSFVNTCFLNFMDYSAIDKHKSILIRENWNPEQTAMDVIRWASTAGITSIQVGTPSGDFVSGSTLTLYGIVG